MRKSNRAEIFKLLASAFVGLASVFSIAHAGKPEAIAAANGSACNAVQPFYWEIGRKWGGPIISGQVGGNTYGRNTQIGIASASKWIFGAYVLQRYGGLPAGPSGATIISSLNMKEGHTSFNPGSCALANKVYGCYVVGNNDVVDPTKVGFFNYGGGDGQYAAAKSNLLGLGNKDANALLTEINSFLNLGSDFSYNMPAVAGGMRASAADYAAFLQKIMKGTYVMSAYLGNSPVTTQCANCNSPFGTADLHYSLYHWIEDNTGGVLPNGTPLSPGDGAYSSPGALGFYPWISAGKGRYGIIATDSSNFQNSYVCGKAVREAYFN